MRNRYPCTGCIKRTRCNVGNNFRRCTMWRSWVHKQWESLQRAQERVQYRAYLRLLLNRSTWQADLEVEQRTVAEEHHV